uniref:Uncharacterized protein n=1 Tax=Dicentrarchus labrax TaxID=13489 RepID=A0A8C4GQS7_DICLA
MGKSQYEKAVMCFSEAITLQPEQLCVSQAEAYLQLCDFQSAAAYYKRARLLEPGAFSARLAFIYYLQVHITLFCFGWGLMLLLHFLNVFCDLYPSLACLTAAGHHTDCLKLVNNWMVLYGSTSDLYILRARLHKLLNQCYQDVKSALALNPTCPVAEALLLQLHEASEQARQQAVDRALTGQLLEALCMINISLANCPLDGRKFYLISSFKLISLQPY